MMQSYFIDELNRDETKRLIRDRQNSEIEKIKNALK